MQAGRYTAKIEIQQSKDRKVNVQGAKTDEGNGKRYGKKVGLTN